MALERGHRGSTALEALRAEAPKPRPRVLEDALAVAQEAPERLGAWLGHLVSLGRVDGTTLEALGPHLHGTRAAEALLDRLPSAQSLASSIVAEARRETGASEMPHHQRIQAAFGPYALDGVDARVAPSEVDEGAHAQAEGDKVRFEQRPDLFTAAHEAAHVVQQRLGKASGGQALERHADEVARAVVEGRSARPLLSQLGPPTRARAVAGRVQYRKKAGGRDYFKKPYRVRLSADTDYLYVIPAKSEKKSTLVAGVDCAEQLLPGIVRALVGANQYDEALGRAALAHMRNQGLYGVADLSGKAGKRQRLSEFRVKASAANDLIRWLRTTQKKRIVGLPPAKLRSLSLSLVVNRSFGWMHRHLGVGRPFPRWMTPRLYKKLVLFEGRALTALQAAYNALRDPKSKAPRPARLSRFKAALSALHRRFRPFVTLLEAIREDGKLVDLAGYRVLFQLPARAKKATGRSGMKPVGAGAAVDLPTAALLRYLMRVRPAQARRGAKKGGSGARRFLVRLLHRVARGLARTSKAFKDSLQRGQLVRDSVTKNNAPPFPSKLTVYPKINKEFPAVAANASYHFRMNVHFPSVYAASRNQTRMQFRWELIRVGKKALKGAREWARNVIHRGDKRLPGELGPLAQRLRRQEKYRQQDLKRVYETFGILGGLGAKLVNANRNIAKIGTLISGVFKLGTADRCEREIAVEEPGVYVVRALAYPHQRPGTGVIRAPSVGFQSLIVRRKKDLVGRALTHHLEARDKGVKAVGKELTRLKAKLASAKPKQKALIKLQLASLTRQRANLLLAGKDHGAAITQQLKQLRAQRVQLLNDKAYFLGQPTFRDFAKAVRKVRRGVTPKKKGAALTKAQRAKLRAAAKLEAQQAAVRRDHLFLAKQMKPGPPRDAAYRLVNRFEIARVDARLTAVNKRISDLETVLSVGQKRHAAHLRGRRKGLEGPRPLPAMFLSDESGAPMALRLELIQKASTDPKKPFRYVISDLTNKNGGCAEGPAHAKRGAAILAAVKQLLEAHGRYGRGNVAIAVPKQGSHPAERRSTYIAASLSALAVEGLDNLTMVASLAAMALAPFTGGASLVFLLPIGAVGALPSAYRLLSRGADKTLRFDAQSAMDLVNILGAAVGLAAFTSASRWTFCGKGVLAMVQGAETAGSLACLGWGLYEQAKGIDPKAHPGVQRAQLMQILGQGLMTAGMMIGGHMAAKAQQAKVQRRFKLADPDAFMKLRHVSKEARASIDQHAKGVDAVMDPTLGAKVELDYKVGAFGMIKSLRIRKGPKASAADLAKTAKIAGQLNKHRGLRGILRRMLAAIKTRLHGKTDASSELHKAAKEAQKLRDELMQTELMVLLDRIDLETAAAMIRDLRARISSLDWKIRPAAGGDVPVIHAQRKNLATANFVETNSAWKADLIETTTGAKWGEITIKRNADGTAMDHVGPEISIDPSKSVKAGQQLNLQHGGRFKWTRAALDLVTELYKKHPKINGGKPPEVFSIDLAKLNLTKFQEAYGRLALAGRAMTSQVDLVEAFKATPAYKSRMDGSGGRVTWKHHEVRPSADKVTLKVDGQDVQVPRAVTVTSSRKAPKRQPSGGGPFQKKGGGGLVPMRRPPATPAQQAQAPGASDPSSAAIKQGTHQASDLDFVNHASAADLARLPGMTPELAQAIVAERGKQPGGRFASAAALKPLVKKLGPGGAFRLLNYSRLPSEVAKGRPNALKATIGANELALRLKTNEALPGRYITEAQARKLGWPGKSLAQIAPGKAIGGDDITGIAAGLGLPQAPGRRWFCADVGVDYTKPGRKGLRLVFSNDGLMFIGPDTLSPLRPFGRFKSAGRGAAGRKAAARTPVRSARAQDAPAAAKQVDDFLKGLAGQSKGSQEAGAQTALVFAARLMGLAPGPKGPLAGIRVRYDASLRDGGMFQVTGTAGKRQGTIVIGPNTTLRALLEEIVHALDFKRSLQGARAGGQKTPLSGFVAQHYLSLLGRSDTPLGVKVQMARAIATRELAACEAMLGLQTPLTTARPELKRIAGLLSEAQRVQLRKDRQRWREILGRLNSRNDQVRSAATAEVPRGHFMKIGPKFPPGAVRPTHSAHAARPTKAPTTRRPGHDRRDSFDTSGRPLAPDRVAPAPRTDADGGGGQGGRQQPDAAWAREPADHTRQVQELKTTRDGRTREHTFTVYADGTIVASDKANLMASQTITPTADAQGIKRFTYKGVDYELGQNNKVLPALREGHYDQVGILAGGQGGPRETLTAGAKALAEGWGNLPRTSATGESQIAALRKLVTDVAAKHPWKLLAPEVELVPAPAKDKARGLGGFFDPVNWKIKLYVPEDDGVSALSGAQLKAVLDTLVHELRHADQFWSRALYLVAKQLDSGVADAALTGKAGVSAVALTAARAALGDRAGARRLLQSAYGGYGRRWALGAGKVVDGKSQDIMSLSVRLHRQMDEALADWRRHKATDAARAQQALDRYNQLAQRYNRLQDERDSNRASAVLKPTIDALAPSAPPPARASHAPKPAAKPVAKTAPKASPAPRVAARPAKAPKRSPLSPLSRRPAPAPAARDQGTQVAHLTFRRGEVVNALGMTLPAQARLLNGQLASVEVGGKTLWVQDGHVTIEGARYRVTLQGADGVVFQRVSTRRSVGSAPKDSAGQPTPQQKTPLGAKDGLGSADAAIDYGKRAQQRFGRRVAGDAATVMAARAADCQAAIAPSLRASGVDPLPTIKAAKLKGNAAAEFDAGRWEIRISKALMQKNRLAPDEVAGLGRDLFHEGSHAEQVFDALRWLRAAVDAKDWASHPAAKAFVDERGQIKVAALEASGVSRSAIDGAFAAASGFDPKGARGRKGAAYFESFFGKTNDVYKANRSQAEAVAEEALQRFKVGRAAQREIARLDGEIIALEGGGFRQRALSAGKLKGLRTQRDAAQQRLDQATKDVERLTDQLAKLDKTYATKFLDELSAYANGDRAAKAVWVAHYDKMAARCLREAGNPTLGAPDKQRMLALALRYGQTAQRLRNEIAGSAGRFETLLRKRVDAALTPASPSGTTAKPKALATRKSASTRAPKLTPGGHRAATTEGTDLLVPLKKQGGRHTLDPDRPVQLGERWRGLPGGKARLSPNEHARLQPVGKGRYRAVFSDRDLKLTLTFDALGKVVGRELALAKPTDWQGAGGVFYRLDRASRVSGKRIELRYSVYDPATQKIAKQTWMTTDAKLREGARASGPRRLFFRRALRSLRRPGSKPRQARSTRFVKAADWSWLPRSLQRTRVTSGRIPPSASADARIVGTTRLGALSDGHAVLRALTGGDTRALAKVGISADRTLKSYEMEWGLGKVPADKGGGYVLVVGGKRGIAWDGLVKAGVVPVAHTHPRAHTLKGSYDSLDKVLKVDGDREAVFPSYGDVHLCYARGIKDHHVFTPWVLGKDGRVARSPGSDSTLTFVIGATTDLGPYALNFSATDFRVYRVRLTAKVGGRVVWRGQMEVTGFGMGTQAGSMVTPPGGLPIKPDTKAPKLPGQPTRSAARGSSGPRVEPFKAPNRPAGARGPQNPTTDRSPLPRGYADGSAAALSHPMPRSTAEQRGAFRLGHLRAAAHGYLKHQGFEGRMPPMVPDASLAPGAARFNRKSWTIEVSKADLEAPSLSVDQGALLFSVAATHEPQHAVQVWRVVQRRVAMAQARTQPVDVKKIAAELKVPEGLVGDAIKHPLSKKHPDWARAKAWDKGLTSPEYGKVKRDLERAQKACADSWRALKAQRERLLEAEQRLASLAKSDPKRGTALRVAQSRRETVKIAQQQFDAAEKFARRIYNRYRSFTDEVDAHRSQRYAAAAYLKALEQHLRREKAAVKAGLERDPVHGGLQARLAAIDAQLKTINQRLAAGRLTLGEPPAPARGPRQPAPQRAPKSTDADTAVTPVKPGERALTPAGHEDGGARVLTRDMSKLPISERVAQRKAALEKAIAAYMAHHGVDKVPTLELKSGYGYNAYFDARSWRVVIGVEPLMQARMTLDEAATFFTTAASHEPQHGVQYHRIIQRKAAEQGASLDVRKLSDELRMDEAAIREIAKKPLSRSHPDWDRAGQWHRDLSGDDYVQATSSMTRHGQQVARIRRELAQARTLKTRWEEELARPGTSAERKTELRGKLRKLSALVTQQREALKTQQASYDKHRRDYQAFAIEKNANQAGAQANARFLSARRRQLEAQRAQLQSAYDKARGLGRVSLREQLMKVDREIRAVQTRLNAGALQPIDPRRVQQSMRLGKRHAQQGARSPRPPHAPASTRRGGTPPTRTPAPRVPVARQLPAQTQTAPAARRAVERLNTWDATRLARTLDSELALRLVTLREDGPYRSLADVEERLDRSLYLDAVAGTRTVRAWREAMARYRSALRSLQHSDPDRGAVLAYLNGLDAAGVGRLVDEQGVKVVPSKLRKSFVYHASQRPFSSLEDLRTRVLSRGKSLGDAADKVLAAAARQRREDARNASPPRTSTKNPPTGHVGTDAGRPGPPAGRRAEVWRDAALRALNSLSREQLRDVHGVGPIIANAILQARALRPIASAADLAARVRGVDTDKAAQILGRLERRGVDAAHISIINRSSQARLEGVFGKRMAALLVERRPFASLSGLQRAIPSFRKVHRDKLVSQLRPEVMPDAQRSPLDYINVASVDDLTAIPGIGRILARRIVWARNRMDAKRFDSWRILFRRVPGIGPTTARALVNYLHVPAALFSSLPQAKQAAYRRASTQLHPVVGQLRSTGKLPAHYITKAEARAQGWAEGKALAAFVPGRALGGDVFTNSDGRLPVAQGRTWYEADIGATYDTSDRGGVRLLYSSDGLLYVTTDHYGTFQPIGIWRATGRRAGAR